MAEYCPMAVLNILDQRFPGFYISLWLKKYQDLEYSKVVNKRGLHRVVNMPE